MKRTSCLISVCFSDTAILWRAIYYLYAILLLIPVVPAGTILNWALCSSRCISKSVKINPSVPDSNFVTQFVIGCQNSYQDKLSKAYQAEIWSSVSHSITVIILQQLYLWLLLVFCSAEWQLIIQTSWPYVLSVFGCYLFLL